MAPTERKVRGIDPPTLELILQRMWDPDRNVYVHPSGATTPDRDAAIELINSDVNALYAKRRRLY